MIFNQGYDIYNGGEKAGFPEAQALELVRLGVAHSAEAEMPATAAAVDSSAQDDTDLITIEQAKADLDKKTKPELIDLAKRAYGLELSESSKKDELIAAIIQAATASTEQK